MIQHLPFLQGAFVLCVEDATQASRSVQRNVFGVTDDDAVVVATVRILQGQILIKSAPIKIRIKLHKVKKYLEAESQLGPLRTQDVSGLRS